MLLFVQIRSQFINNLALFFETGLLLGVLEFLVLLTLLFDWVRLLVKVVNIIKAVGDHLQKQLGVTSQETDARLPLLMRVFLLILVVLAYLRRFIGFRINGVDP